MPINQLVIPYPDFQNLQIIDSEKFDSNNAAIVAKSDEIAAFCNTIDITNYYSKLQVDNKLVDKINIWEAVDLVNNQTVGGNKVFTGDISVPFPNSVWNPTTKEYVDNAITSLLSGIAPAGSITDDKLSNTNGQIKNRVSDLIADVNDLNINVETRLLKAGGNVTGTLSLAGNIIDYPTIRKYKESITVATGVSGTYAINLINGSNYSLTLSGATTITVTGWVASGTLNPLTIEIVQPATAYAVTLPASFKFANSTAPNIVQISRKSVITGYSRDGGVTVICGSITNIPL